MPREREQSIKKDCYIGSLGTTEDPTQRRMSLFRESGARLHLSNGFTSTNFIV